MKSLDKVVAELELHPMGFRLLFPGHSPRILGANLGSMKKLIESGVSFFKDGRYSIKIYSKTVVIRLVVPERGHDEAKFDKSEFLALLASA